MFSDISDRWLVLRCGTNATLKLVDALKSSGVDAWSPIRVVVRRAPRRLFKIKVEISTLPTFVFMPYSEMDKVLLLRQRCALPSFSFMKLMGIIVTVHKDELEFMQKVSWNNVKAKPIPIGSSVRFRSGSFAGIEGRVTDGDDKDCTVQLKGSDMIVKVPPFLLVKLQA